MRYEQNAVDWLKGAIQINSTLGNEKRVADYIEVLLNDVEIETKQVEYAPGRNQLIATIQGKEPGKVLGFSGHMDVVPVGSLPWEHDPFSAEEIDGKIYGRGSSDMKSGLIAAVTAMIKLKEQNFPLKGTIKLLATVGEESSAIGSEQLVHLGYADDLDALIIGEPTMNQIITSHKGALWLRLTTIGKTAHGSMPQLGMNAVEHMMYFLETFKNEMDLSSYTDPLLGPATASITVVNGGTGTNVIPDQCISEIDIRTVPEVDHSQLLIKIKQLIEKVSKEIQNFHMEMSVINDLPCIHTEPNDPFVTLAAESVGMITGTIPKPLGSPGYTDGSRFVQAKKRFPILILGPGNGYLAHQPDEYAEVKAFIDNISIYEQIAREFLK